MVRLELPTVSHTRFYRICKDANLAMRRRKKAKRSPVERVPLKVAQGLNKVWTMVLVSDNVLGRHLLVQIDLHKQKIQN